MKVIVFEKYGSPDGLEIKEMAKPIPKDDEVLVKVHAVGVNPLDWHRMRGAPFVVRFTDGLRKPKSPFLGADIAGRVETVGKDVKQFQVGDDVFAEIGAGGLAEYACASPKVLAKKPSNLTYAEAASVPVAALTALQALRDHGQIQAEQKVLINGASGGVGTFAVQMAKVFGAEVTAVCSKRNIEMVRSLGADDVIDYTKEKPTQRKQAFDLILDNVGNLSVGDYKRTLKPGGTAVVVGFTTLSHMIPVMVLGMLNSKFGNYKISSMLAHPNQADMNVLKEMLEAGQVVPVIDRCYPFAETADAMRYLENGRARGKVIVSLVAS